MKTKNQRFTPPHLVALFIIFCSVQPIFSQVISPTVFGGSFIDNDCHSIGIDHCPSIIGGMVTVASKNSMTYPYFVVQQYKKKFPYIFDQNLQGYTIDKTHFIVDKNGKVGVGTANPSEKFHVLGDALLEGDVQIEDNAYLEGYLQTETLNLGDGTSSLQNTFKIKVENAGVMDELTFVEKIGSNESNIMTIVNNELVVHKLLKATQKLQVGNKTINMGSHTDAVASFDGKIVSKQSIVTIDNWADHVFAEDYELKPLEEVAAFIEENKHLPEIPSEAEVLEEGVDVAEMNRLLLLKIEELTLYMIDLEKSNQSLQAQIHELKNQ